MNYGRLDFYCAYAPQYLGYRLDAVGADPGKRERHILTGPLTVQKAEPGAYPGEPLLFLSDEDAQSLLDALWKAGIRPSRIVNAEVEASAMQSHIADLRKITFSLLRKK